MAARIIEKNHFFIKNKGNSFNPYIFFQGCNTMLDYRRVNLISSFEKVVQNEKNLARFDRKFWYGILDIFPISIGRVSFYNNIAYYLQKANYSKNALLILDKILHRTPNRTVAHLNYAQGVDALLQRGWNRKYTSKISIKHKLTYTAQMLQMDKVEKMNSLIKSKYRGYWGMLNEMNRILQQRYHILDFTWGDLNADKKSDIAFVVEITDSSKIEDFISGKARPINHNTRAIFVFVRTARGYSLVAQNREVLQADEQNSCDDNFDWASIKKGKLVLQTHQHCYHRGWKDDWLTYSFGFYNRALVLTDSNSWWASKKTGNGERKSANFLTGNYLFQKIAKRGKRKMGKAILKPINNSKILNFNEVNKPHVEGMLK